MSVRATWDGRTDRTYAIRQKLTSRLVDETGKQGGILSYWNQKGGGGDLRAASQGGGQAVAEEKDWLLLPPAPRCVACVDEGIDHDHH